MEEKNKIVPIISVLLIVGSLMTSLVSFFVSRASLRSEIVNNELPLTSDNIYSEIQRDLLRPIYISSVMATDTFLRDWVLRGEKDDKDIIKYLNDIKMRYGAFTSFFVSDKTLKYYHVDKILKSVSADEERDKWYFRVRDMADDYEINVDPDMANRDAMTIFINYRVFDYDGNYIGATGIGLTVNAVKNLLKTYQSKYERHIYFVDHAGNVKLSVTDSLTLQENISQEILDNMNSVNADESLEMSFNFSRNGELVHTNMRYISEFGWYLIVEQAEAHAIARIVNALLINLFICAIVTMIVIISVNLSIKRYQNRIKTLRGIVPICSYCKQIRDDEGYWEQVDIFIRKHSHAEFSHGICPDCFKKHHPDYSNKV